MRKGNPSSLLLLCLATSLALACGSSIAVDTDGGPGADGGPDAGPDGGPDAGPDGGVSATCGNGILEPGEECDDGNTVDFDGCSSTCQVEESQRVDWMQMQFATDSVCTANALGKAIVLGVAQDELQNAITAGIGDGTINVLMTFLGKTDPTGADESGLSIGVLGGEPQEPAGAPSYDGTSDLDWWYSPDANSVDATGAPLARLGAGIQGGALTAGPGAMTLNVSFGSGVVSMVLSDAVLQATLGALSAPLESTDGLPPGHLPSEHVSPSLRSFGSTGAQTSAGAGTLCGHVSAKSLSTAPLTAQVVSACSSFTTSNSLLDLMVSGCKAYGLVEAVAATQPDQVDASATAAGAGAPYTLSASSGVTVDTCKDKSGQTVELDACLTAAAYSSYFKFTTDRVIIRPDEQAPDAGP